jgi:hypothetical protein
MAKLPPLVVIDRPRVLVSAPVVTNCTNYSVSAYLTNASGDDLDFLWYLDSNPTETFNFYADMDKPGTYATQFFNGYSDTGTVAWIPTSMTFKYGTWNYIASSRVGTAVYINTQVQQYSNSYAGVISPAGRISYLQRYIGGTWQNMIARTSNSTGRWTAGFIQTKVYQYRILTHENGTALSATSASTFR